MRLMFPKGKTFPFLSRYVGVSLPDITQSMRFVPFLQPFQRFWMTLRTCIQNSTSSRSADLPSFSEREDFPLYESDRAIPYFHFRIWYFTWGIQLKTLGFSTGPRKKRENENFHFGRRNGK